MKKVCSLFLIIVALISCSSCGAPNFVIKKYYRDKSNFKEYTAIVEGYGDLFAWGETSTKDSFEREKYQYYHTGYTDKDGIK